MSDEASSSAAAAYPDTADANDDDERHHHLAVPTAAELAERRKKNRAMFNRKRGELLDDALRNWDMLVYAQLSAIYYQDCSFLRFLLRAFVQFVFLTPKPPIFPAPPANRPYIGAILGANLLCLFLHAVYAAPSAGEATRGYLHGGLAMDFIGQKGPTSKIVLVLLDLLVVVLQLGHLSMHITRQRLKDSALSVTTSTGREYTAAAAPSSTTQDLDSEERGVRRSDEQQDIEMQTLDRSGAAQASANEEHGTEAERDSFLSSSSSSSSTTAPRTTDHHIFDAFNSGQIVLADLDIVQTVREQFWAYQLAPSEEADTHSSTRDIRANLTGHLLRWRFGATVGRPAQRV
ncbi:hypothetical protein LTR85_001834 [Meristemomyces frigidus]|nr:hypothetical protein LTR85_001834 [Meristemomyces frigidus]